MQERHGLPLRSFSSGKALTAGRAVRPEVAQERRYLQGAPLGLELPGRIALRDPHCAWQWFEPEAAAEAFPAAHWLAAFLVLLGRYGNEEITLGFPEPITVRGRQAPALLRSSYRAMESSAERSARLAEELDDARRQLSADGQERAALAGRCAVQVLAARPTASSPGWLALVLAADGSVGLALRDPQYDELRRIAGHLARLARGLVDAQACVGRLPWLDADEERRLQALRSEPQAARRAAYSTICSRPRRGAHRSASPCTPPTVASAMPSWSAKAPRSPCACAPPGWLRSSGSGSACGATAACWSACLACSAPAVATSRWTRPIRRSGWPTCSTTPTACWCWSTRAPASGSPRWAGHA